MTGFLHQPFSAIQSFLGLLPKRLRAANVFIYFLNVSLCSFGEFGLGRGHPGVKNPSGYACNYNLYYPCFLLNRFFAGKQACPLFEYDCLVPDLKWLGR